MTIRASARQEKLAAVYDTDIWPLVPERAGEAILRALPKRPASVVFEAGAAGGRLTLAVAERLDDASRVLAIESSPALLAVAERAKAAHAAGPKVSFHLGELAPPFPVEDGAYDVALSNLALGDARDPAAAVADLSRCLKPGGQALVTVPLRGCWAEFLDLYRDVLTEQGKRDALSRLRAYEASLPAPGAAVAWFEGAGLRDVAIETVRWEILFKSAREFFFAPVIDLGPLGAWKQIAGGRGDEMQDAFFFVKEAIEAYFSKSVFPLTMLVGCVRGTKPGVPKT